MSGSYEEQPGKGVMYFETDRKTDKHPQFKGYLVLEMDYKAGEKLKLSAWQRDTSRGVPLISLKEDNFMRKKREEAQAAGPREVKPSYGRGRDEDVPF